MEHTILLLSALGFGDDAVMLMDRSTLDLDFDILIRAAQSELDEDYLNFEEKMDLLSFISEILDLQPSDWVQILSVASQNHIDLAQWIAGHFGTFQDIDLYPLVCQSVPDMLARTSMVQELISAGIPIHDHCPFLNYVMLVQTMSVPRGHSHIF